MNIDAKDIKPGQLIAEHGLITAVDHKGENKFFSGKPNVNFICYHDAYHGVCSSWLKDGTVELVEGDEREEWLKQAEEELIDHAKNIREDLQLIKTTMENDNGTDD